MRPSAMSTDELAAAAEVSACWKGMMADATHRDSLAGLCLRADPILCAGRQDRQRGGGSGEAPSQARTEDY